MKQTQAFVYKWTHTPTLNWYIGSRTAKFCHPDDGYICSSNVVRPLVIENPNEWAREIVMTGEPKEMRELEGDILEMLDASRDSRSWNKHNGGKWSNTGGIHTAESRAKMSQALLGRKKPRTAEHQANLTKAITGKKRSPDFCRKISESQIGTKRSDACRLKMSESLKGRITPIETREKQSLANKGKKFSAERCAAIRNGIASKSLEKFLKINGIGKLA